jgi:glycosyltransferase involved in cell wall biosynthesis
VGFGNGLNILAVTSLYLPTNYAGAEVMLHQILIELKEKGNNVKVLCNEQPVSELDGISLHNISDSSTKKTLGKWADVIITHLGGTPSAIVIAAEANKPLAHLVHNDKQIRANRLNRRNAQLLISNSKWIDESIDLYGVDRTIINPPANPNTYKTKPGKAITLVNLSKEKGSDVFWQLARIFPDKEFIGVVGGYGDQHIYDKVLSNVTIVENTSNILDIYSKTRIVLMPSSYESWGKVATEALCSGIPVIVSETPGLRESVGYAGIFVNKNDIAGYVEAIRELDSVERYNYQSKLCIDRSIELHEQFKIQIDALEKKLKQLKKKRGA